MKGAHHIHLQQPVKVSDIINRFLQSHVSLSLSKLWQPATIGNIIFKFCDICVTFDLLSHTCDLYSSYTWDIISTQSITTFYFLILNIIECIFIFIKHRLKPVLHWQGYYIYCLIDMILCSQRSRSESPIGGLNNFQILIIVLIFVCDCL